MRANFRHASGRFPIAAAALLGCAASAGGAIDLPHGQGGDIVAAKCSTCHPLANTLTLVKIQK